MEYSINRLKAGRRNCIERQFPGSDVTVRVRLLTNQDVLDASLAADRIFREAGVEVSMQNVKVYEAEKDVQHLYRACADINGGPLAPTIADFRCQLTVSDKERLIEWYNELDAECNPSADTMTDGDFDALVESVKKNPEAVSKVSSISTLRRLARFLASPPVSLQTGNGLT
jgi:phage FluMu protein gp41